MISKIKSKMGSVWIFDPAIIVFRCKTDPCILSD